MKKWVLLALLLGCPDRAPKGAELRVPLPDGWVATGSTERLVANPRGRGVVTFESKSEVLPALRGLVTTLEAQGSTDLEPTEEGEFRGVRYTVEREPAFVAVKTVGARTIWCASMLGASTAEVSASFETCHAIELR